MRFRIQGKIHTGLRVKQNYPCSLFYYTILKHSPAENRNIEVRTPGRASGDTHYYGFFMSAVQQSRNNKQNTCQVVCGVSQQNQFLTLCYLPLMTKYK
jgi:hypothetical protein